MLVIIKLVNIVPSPATNNSIKPMKAVSALPRLNRELIADLIFVTEFIIN